MAEKKERKEVKDLYVQVLHAKTKKQKEIVIPQDMELDDAVEWIRRKQREDEREVAIHEIVDTYPLDGALALAIVLKERYGWTSLVPTPRFFGGQDPPNMIGVQIDINETVQVPWGRMKVPGVEGFINTELHWDEMQPKFKIGGEVKRKHEKEIGIIADLVRAHVKKHSIYRNKAIRIAFIDPRNAGSLEDFNPEFIDVKDIKPDELVFSGDVMEQVNTSLFTPIQNTEFCRKHRIPLKRGVLLAGDYGTGKTLTADVAAKLCIESGEWTFIYLKDVSDLEQAIYFGRNYQPAMIFAEDIDQVTAGREDERDEVTTKILNTIDGVDTKHTELIVALTTNHLDKINPAMLRPGRLDAVIPVLAPDAEAVVRLLQIYGRGLIEDSKDLLEVGKTLAEEGAIPAMIREVVERSKLAAAGREDGEFKITARELHIAAKGMAQHLSLLKPKQRDKRGDVEKAVDKAAAYFLANPEAQKAVLNGSSGNHIPTVAKIIKGVAELEDDGIKREQAS